MISFTNCLLFENCCNELLVLYFRGPMTILWELKKIFDRNRSIFVFKHVFCVFLIKQLVIRQKSNCSFSTMQRRSPSKCNDWFNIRLGVILYVMVIHGHVLRVLRVMLETCNTTFSIKSIGDAMLYFPNVHIKV